MSTKLAIALKTVIEERGLAGNIGDVAKRIGVAYPSLKKVLDGTAKPNKATIGKYQAFLGIGEEDLANLLGGKAEKAGKPGRRRRKGSEETEEVPTIAADGGDHHGEKDVTQALSATTEPTYAKHGSVSAALDRAIAALDGVLKDDLALRVHAAPAGIRGLIQRILG